MQGRIKSLLASLVIILVLGGCSIGISTTDSADNAPTPARMTRTPAEAPTSTPILPGGTISIWHSWQSPQMPALLRSISTFQEKYPYVYFDVQYIPDIDLKAGFIQASLDNRAPSILIGPGSWGIELQQQGLVVDLSQLINPALLEQLNQAGVISGQVDGEQIGLPIHLQGVVLYRNSAVIQRPPATMDELVSLAKGAEKGDRFGAVLERSFFFSGGHLLGAGGRWMNPDGTPAFNTESGLEWVRLLREYERAGPTEYLSDNDLNMFKEGRVGFIIDGTWNRQEIAEAIGSENLAIDPWPVYSSGSLAGFVTAENVYLSPKALQETHMVSWLFVQHLLSPESMAYVAENGMIPAVSNSALNVLSAQIQSKDRLTSQAMKALQEGVPYSYMYPFDIYSIHLDSALQSIFSGQASPAAGLLAAQEAIIQAMQTPPTSLP